jgi:hypothetical protein
MRYDNFLKSDAMSLEQICNSTKCRLDDIEGRVPNFWNNLNVYDVAVILRIVSEQFAAVYDLAKDNEDFDQRKIISQEQMQNIMGLFQELTDNFFPMAHTSDRLGNLRIINLSHLSELWAMQREGIYTLTRSNEMMERVLNP